MILPMQAATLDILIDKGKFSSPAARAIAEAIDLEIQGAQLVTLPVLDSRLAGLRQEVTRAIADAGNSITRQMYFALLGQMTVLLGVLYFFVTHLAR